MRDRPLASLALSGTASCRSITSFPWGLEYQTRLLRNLPSRWAFSGANHTEGRFLGDWELNALPIYHLDLLVNSLEARRRKRDFYEESGPDLALAENFPLNDQYLPEQHGPIALADVPAADRDAIELMLRPPDPPRGVAPEVEPTAMTEILANNGIREEVVEIDVDGALRHGQAR